MEENIANRRGDSTRAGDYRRHMREIEELLIHIIKTTGGGGRLPYELVDRIVQHRTGRNLSTLVDYADTETHVLEYIKINLLTDTPLLVSLKDESLSLRCDESTLDCSAELEDSLVQVKASWNTTVLDLSRRCFSSKTELLEVCESVRMLKRLILRDIQIHSLGEESPLNFALIERIKWYCPALEEVDITGCSTSVLDELFQRGRSLNESTFGVHALDLLANKPEAKELLMPSCITSDMSDAPCRIKKLVQEGIPANISYDGWSLLHTAIVIGDVDLVTWLLEKSVSRKAHLASSKGPTPLEMAIHFHNAPIVKQLLHETNYIDPAKLVDLCFLSDLVENDPDVPHHINHSDGCDPLQVVTMFIERNSLAYRASLLVEVAKVFQRVSPRELNEKTCWTEDSISEIFKALVLSEFSPDIPIKDLGGKTPLMCAVSSPVLVKMLLDLGAKSHATDEEGNTALFYAVSEATVETADEYVQSSKLLLEHNADANHKNKYGETPLLYAASKAKTWSQVCNLEIWKLLVQSEAEIAVLNKDRKSLMHLVIDRAKRNLEQLQNSNPVEISNLSQSAVAHCVEQINFVSEHNDKLVRSRDCMGNTPLHLLAEHNSPCTDEMLAIANTLIDVGSNVKVTNDQGKTPLHLAKTWSMAKFLLEQGAKPNVPDDMSCTPLLCRAKEPNLERMPALETLWKWSEGVNLGMDLWQEDSKGQNVFQVLMESGNFEDLKPFIDASINNDRESILRTDSNGNTLLHHLCKYNDSRVLPLVDLLLQSGVNVNAQNANGDAALHNTCRSITRLPKQKGHNSVQWKVIPKLLAYGADCKLRNSRDATVRNIAWFDKKLLKAIDKDVRQLESRPIYPWIENSQNHYRLLSTVTRGQNCQKIRNYCYSNEPIGSGAYSNVYAAINVQDGREVALKRTDTYRLKTRQDDREISTLLQLANCQQIVNYINFFREPDFTWIALELMEGTLDDLLQQGICKDSLSKLCNDVMLGVEYLHKNSILHRDLKPSNVLYSSVPKHCLKIADFGLSKKLGTGQGSSVLHSNAGTRFWMAPELLLSTGHLQHTFASDVFACGLIMHHMLADRRHPFEGNTRATDGRSIADWNEVQKNITTGTITLSADLSDEAKDLLAHVLSSESKDRPTASEALKHPLFWCCDRKARFVCAVANQSEIGTFRGMGTVASPVELEIENNLASMFHPTWDSLFPAIYLEMTSSARGRRYDTSSGVHLVRFIRNAYAHVSDSARPTGFQKDLLKEWVFFKELPNLFMVVFKAVKRGNWHNSREEIASVMRSDN